jgi:hypothetical protein
MLIQLLILAGPAFAALSIVLLGELPSDAVETRRRDRRA